MQAHGIPGISLSLRRGGRNQLDAGEAGALLPEPLEPGAVHILMWFAGDYQRMLIISCAPSNRLRMLRINGSVRQLWESKVPDLFFADVSADGRWLAVGTQDGGRGTTIVELGSGNLVKELAIGDAVPRFSPDGRWLVTTTGRLTAPDGECCLWQTDTWEKVRTRPLHRSSSSPSTPAVTPDGTSVAVAWTMSEVPLLRLDTLEEIVRLPSPEPGPIAGVVFSPNGCRLFGTVANTVHVWDFGALHRGLQAVGLDWDLGGELAQPSQLGPPGNRVRSGGRSFSFSDSPAFRPATPAQPFRILFWRPANFFSPQTTSRRSYREKRGRAVRFWRRQRNYILGIVGRATPGTIASASSA